MVGPSPQSDKVPPRHPSHRPSGQLHSLLYRFGCGQQIPGGPQAELRADRALEAAGLQTQISIKRMSKKIGFKGDGTSSKQLKYLVIFW